MIEQQPWIFLSSGMMEEYEECYMEGLDVEAYKATCQLARDTQNEKLAHEVCEAMHAAPMRPDFTYVEPSDYEEIVKASPDAPFVPARKLTDDELKDRLEGAWLGRMAGCLLGKPTEGFPRDIVYPMLKATGNYPLHQYITKKGMVGEYAEMVEKPGTWFYNRCYADLTGGISPSDDDTNYTVLGLKLIDTYGKNFRPNDVLEAWLSWMPYLFVCTAERVAYRNATMGLRAPETATYHNPYREWIGAQIRADFFGYVNPGDPKKAAEFAWRDASISHTKNGIYGEMFAAACIAAAPVSETVEQIIQAGLNAIPKNCRLRRDIDMVLDWQKNGLSVDEMIDRIHEIYPPHAACGWVNTNPNTMIVAMALLKGDNQFGKSMCLAVQACYDTDCNGATVGSIMGAFLGTKGIEEEWLEPFHGKLHTQIDGYALVDAKQMAIKTFELIRS